MNEYAAEQIRNVGVISHGDVGKTSLVEAMLFSAGATNRLGSVDDGTTACDYLHEEISRKITIRASLAQFEWNKTKLNVIDTPGYSDFGGDIVSSLRVTESVVVMLSAQAGVEVGTEAAWRVARKRNQAAFVFINRMDKEYANFDKAVEMAQDRIGSACVPVQFPVNSGENFNAVIDIIKMKMLTYGEANGTYTESDIPADLLERAVTLR
ncbi:GTP-binding protein, partial [bacterium]|nr:GTP-binding protein [bacterium]